MSDEFPARAPQPADGPGVLRLLALVAVAAGVTLLAAAAFVLSYGGIHAVALSAGVSPRLARIYPLIFDAMLVVACAAVLSLRGAGLPSRVYAWLSMLVLLASAAVADALHATGTRLPHRPAAAAAAVIPWVLVLIGFGLLLSMLRQARLRRVAAAAARQAADPEPSGLVILRRQPDSPPRPGAPPAGTPAPPVETSRTPATPPAAHPEPSGLATAHRPPDSPPRPGTPPAGTPAPPVEASRTPATPPAAHPEPSATAHRPPDSPPRPGTPPAGTPAPPVETSHAVVPDLALDLAIEAEPGQDDPVSDEAGPADYPETPQVPRARAEQPAGYSGHRGALSGSAFTPAPTGAAVAIPGPAASAGPGLGTDHGYGPDSGPVPQIMPAAEIRPAGEAAADLTAGTEAEPDSEAEVDTAELHAEAETEPSPDAKAGPDAKAEPDAEAEPDPEAEPGLSDPLTFDRMRSSPIPPQASAP